MSPSDTTTSKTAPFPASAKPYLDAVPKNHRPAVVRLFLDSVRHFDVARRDDLSAVDVLRVFQEKANDSLNRATDEGERRAWKTALTLTTLYRSAGRKVAGWAINYLSVPYEERAAKDELQSTQNGQATKEQVVLLRSMVIYLFKPTQQRAAQIIVRRLAKRKEANRG